MDEPKVAKACTKCKILKSLEVFPRNKAMRDGRNSWCRDCANDFKRRARSQMSPGARRGEGLRRWYGLTLEQYEQLVVDHGHECPACHRKHDPEGSAADTLNVDHCHRTGRIRGLLCGNCNRALGLLRDEPAIIEALLRYAQDRC